MTFTVVHVREAIRRDSALGDFNVKSSISVARNQSKQSFIYLFDSPPRTRKGFTTTANSSALYFPTEYVALNLSIKWSFAVITTFPSSAVLRPLARPLAACSRTILLGTGSSRTSSSGWQKYASE
jgi:hypothetical protein